MKKSQRIRIRFAKMLMSIVGVALLTLIAFELHFNLASATSLHLFWIATLALRWGVWEASVGSVASVLCLDYFFTDPLFQFTMSDPRDWVSLLTFEGAALLVSQLSSQIRKHASDVEEHKKQLETLYSLSQNILALDWSERFDQNVLTLVSSSFGLKASALWNSQSSTFTAWGACALKEDDLVDCYSKCISETMDDTCTLHLLRSGGKPIGALYVDDPDIDEQTFSGMSSLVTIALERAHAFHVESQASAEKYAEQLRSSILDGLAHTFKSPLTTIRTCSSGLLAVDSLSPKERKLMRLIDGEAGRLAELVDETFEIAQLDRTLVHLQKSEAHLGKIIERSIQCVPERGRRRVEVDVRERVPMVMVDARLISMALTQIVDNALKYGTANEPVHIHASIDQGMWKVVISNQGSYIPSGEIEKIFDRYYRSPSIARSTPGSGIGLSVAKQIVEAHQGTIRVVSHSGQGTSFSISLPAGIEEGSLHAS